MMEKGGSRCRTCYCSWTVKVIFFESYPSFGWLKMLLLLFFSLESRSFVFKIQLMSKTSTQTNIDLPTLLSGVAHLKVKELEAFAIELNGLITQKKRKTKAWRKGELLTKINHTVLSQTERKRLKVLSEKLQEGTMTKEEQREHLAIAEKEETYRAQRLAAMINLAKLKNQTLPELMIELGLTPPPHV